MDDQTKMRLMELISPGRFAYYDSIGSTNDVAQQWVSEGTPDFSLVAADEQTMGRGRNTRKWFTLPNSALAFSLILTSNLEIDNLPFYTGLGAVAVCRTFERMTDSRVEIKWPNDVLIDGKKAVGILVEGVWSGSSLKGIILGIGINVTAGSVPLDVDLLFPATYLESVTKNPVDRYELLEHVISEILFVRQEIEFGALLEQWDQRLAFKDELVYILNSDGDQISGRLKGISEKGKLILELQDGEEKQFASNEIRLRPFSVE